MILYKLTDANGRTYRKTQWGVGVTHKAADPGKGPLCGPGWIHAYEHPLLAVLHDPIHGQFGPYARLWECKTDDDRPLRDGQMKIGVRSLTTIREIPLPKVTTKQRVRYSILCAWKSLTGHREEWVRMWRAWARRWLSGEDRSRDAVAWGAAAWAVTASTSTTTTPTCTSAAWAAAAAAAEAAEAAMKDLDLAALAEKAVREEE